MTESMHSALQSTHITRPIQVLDPLVAERIAAGEVIERPASVVKELIENAIDAGTTSIRVTLEDGGKTFIQVTDNGSGIASDQLELAIERHATSKLTTFDDLDSLLSLGFRGEALPSLVAVGDLEIISRTERTERSELPGRAQLSKSAYVLQTTQGRLTHSVKPKTFGQFLGQSHGTQITLTGLFSTIPARYKFLKSNSSEVSAIREVIERHALSHPEIQFELISNSKRVLFFPRAPLPERVKQILCNGDDLPVISFHRKAPLEIEAHWVQGLSSAQTKKIIQLVNHRPLKDRLLQSAVLSAFSQALLPGQYPALVLKIQIPASEIDVNVHPTKTEVRFRDSGAVFREIKAALEQMIQENGNMPWVAGRWVSPVSSVFQPLPKTESLPFTPMSSHIPPSSFTASASGTAPSPVASPTSSTSASNEPSQSVNPIPVSFSNYRGTLFSTYLLFDQGREIVLIDQHAAHERIRYEALKNRFERKIQNQASQTLLIPEAVLVSPEAVAPLTEALPLLNQLGFEAEWFGDTTLLFRALPVEWLLTQKATDSTSLKTRLHALIERLTQRDHATQTSSDQSSKTHALLWDHTLFEKLASEACHSSIRAGDRLEPEEAKALITQLFETEHPWNCPHGRPTTVKISQAKFEEWFQRRV